MFESLWAGLFHPPHHLPRFTSRFQKGDVTNSVTAEAFVKTQCDPGKYNTNPHETCCTCVLQPRLVKPKKWNIYNVCFNSGNTIFVFKCGLLCPFDVFWMSMYAPVGAGIPRLVEWSTTAPGLWVLWFYWALIGNGIGWSLSRSAWPLQIQCKYKLKIQIKTQHTKNNSNCEENNLKKIGCLFYPVKL